MTTLLPWSELCPPPPLAAGYELPPLAPAYELIQQNLGVLGSTSISLTKLQPPRHYQLRKQGEFEQWQPHCPCRFDEEARQTSCTTKSILQSHQNLGSMMLWRNYFVGLGAAGYGITNPPATPPALNPAHPRTSAKAATA
jgi:hypothetical protein